MLKSRGEAQGCAPIFVFLTGLSAWLYANPPSGVTRNVREFLLKRGLLLIALVVAVAMKVVGALLITSLLIIPPAAARPRPSPHSPVIMRARAFRPTASGCTSPPIAAAARRSTKCLPAVAAPSA